MFTGLVQATGHLELLSQYQMQIHWSGIDSTTLADLELGDSIAVDGVCLTVASATQDGFIADVSPETLSRSTLGSRSARQRVNLERSLRVGAKIGGHFVTGHIDGIGHLSEVSERGDAWELSFRVPAPIARYIVPKGSIAINGISLTVAETDAGGGWFKVAVIPHTYAMTNLSSLQPRDSVNVEGDILGKYVEKLLTGRGDLLTDAQSQTPIDLGFLTEHGYA